MILSKIFLLFLIANFLTNVCPMKNGDGDEIQPAVEEEQPSASVDSPSGSFSDVPLGSDNGSDGNEIREEGSPE